MSTSRKQFSKLPRLPSLAQIGIAPNLTQEATRKSSMTGLPYPKVSDSTKKVTYNPVAPRNTRVYAPKVASSTYPEMKITQHGEVIARFIEQYPVMAVDSPTGTGKTRYLPYLMATKGYKVRVAIPTTVAVRDAFKFQRNHTTLRVGYAAGREVHYSDDDQLVYATTGHFTSRIIGLIQNGDPNYVKNVLGDILFIDEVHTATSQITLLIGLIRHLFPDDPSGKNKGSQRSEDCGARMNCDAPKVIFSTATFNHADIRDHYPDFPVYRIDLTAMPVEDIYLSVGNEHDPLKDSPDTLIIDIVRKELTKWEQSIQKYHGIVFRPGVQEVEDTIDALERHFPKDAPVEFYPAYSGLSPDELDSIFQKSNKMKVIVGTNLIESSVTIEDVGFIIDDMLEKVAETSATGGQRLSLSLISQAGSQQRRGRTGRTVPGRNYKLMTQTQFNTLPQFRQREIDRVPIINVVLQLIDAQLNPREIIKVSISRYEQARRLLIQFGMVESKDDRYVVTDIGRFVSSIPLSVQTSFMIYLGFHRYITAAGNGVDSVDLGQERVLLRTIIAVASMIESYGPNYFYVPRKKREETPLEYTVRKEAYVEKYHEKFKGPTDIHTFVNIFWEMMTQINVVRTYDIATRSKFINYIREWSKNNSMNNKKMKEFLIAMREVESIIESKMDDIKELRLNTPQSGYNLDRSLPSGGFTALGNVAAEIFAQAYAGNRLTKDVDRRGKVVYVDKSNGIAYRLRAEDKYTTPEIIAAQLIEVTGQGGTKFHLAGIIVSSEYFPESMK